MITKSNISAVKGMRNIFPPDSYKKQEIINQCQTIAQQFGYLPWELPILERTELFKKTLGDDSDVVGKEMYSFVDIGGEDVCLRPEGTAGAIRAGLEHGLFYNLNQRVSYHGSMFRREKPQKGRFRQFTQFGFEYLGASSPLADIEMILITKNLLAELKIIDSVVLEINSIGTSKQRAEYCNYLKRWEASNVIEFSPEQRRTFENNPLRILDTKDALIKSKILNLPTMVDFLLQDQINNFSYIKNILSEKGITFIHNPLLVRGLDYYNDFVFEWKLLNENKSQNSIIAGGRYDSLPSVLGGSQNYAIGCAVGVDRILDYFDITTTSKITFYFIPLDQLSLVCLDIEVEKLRRIFKDTIFVIDHSLKGLKTQIRNSESYNPCVYIIMGDKERLDGKIMIKSSNDNSALYPINEYVNQIERIIKNGRS
ncbi:MAG: histidine--tRNA ligase [Methylacidiphilales bacterium]|nr:histidine--tRNA ligase [Candidatus Methylacidiphilales bacterium]